MRRLGEIGSPSIMNQDDADYAGHNDSLLSLNTTLRRAWKQNSFTNPLSDPVTRAVIVVNYSIVFLACFVGNFLVLFVIARNKGMRTRTNLFLANLAVADLCVGIICIFPSLHQYLFLEWFLGKAMCKLCRFVESMNLTASMFLLEVVATERYIAINHPLKARRLFTRNKIYFAQFAVWIISSVYNIPILFLYDLHEIPVPSNSQYFCYSDHRGPGGYNSMAMFDIVTFALWYVLPLIVMTALYASMANTLWKSTLPNQIMSLGNRHANVSLRSSSQSERSTASKGMISNSKRCETFSSSTPNPEASTILPRLRRKFNDGLNVSNELELPQLYSQNTRVGKGSQEITQTDGIDDQSEAKSRGHESKSSLSPSPSNNSDGDQFSFKREHVDETPTSSANPNVDFDKLLEETPNKSYLGPQRISRPTSPKSCRYRLTSHRASRRRVIRLLIVVVGSFAILVLPNHVRLLTNRFENSRMGAFVGPVCSLLMFLNSALNPLLYSLLSQSFRRNLKKTLCCCSNRPQRKRKTRHSDPTSGVPTLHA